MNAEVKQKLSDLLTGVEGPTRQRAVDLGMALYDAYANSWPGPIDATVKATYRPHAKANLTEMIDDLFSGI